MRDITVYVITNPDGKVHVRTKALPKSWLARPGNGYRQESATLNWKAARRIAQDYQAQGESR